VKVTAGQAAPPADAFGQAGTPFIRAGSVEGLMTRANWSDLEHLSEASARKRGMKLFPADTILFAKSGMSATLGRVFRTDRPAYIVSHLAALQPVGKADPAFLKHWLIHFGTQHLIKDPAYPSIRLADIEEMPFPNMPMPEQRRIAAILDQADALRGLRRQSLSRLSDLGQAIFFEMFGDVAANSRGWDEGYVLNDVAYVSSGITKGRKANGKVMREVPYLAVSNVQDGQVRLDVVKTIEATDAEIQRYALEPNDIVLTEGGDPDKLGRGGIWRGEIAECIHQNHVFRVRLTDPNMRPLFLSRLIGSERGKRYFLRSAKQTTGIASINMTQLKNFPLLSPPKEIQLEFEANMGRLNKEMKRAKLAYEVSEHLFASLQHRAFRGEL